MFRLDVRRSNSVVFRTSPPYICLGFSLILQSLSYRAGGGAGLETEAPPLNDTWASKSLVSRTPGGLGGGSRDFKSINWFSPGD